MRYFLVLGYQLFLSTALPGNSTCFEIFHQHVNSSGSKWIYRGSCVDRFQNFLTAFVACCCYSNCLLQISQTTHWQWQHPSFVLQSQGESSNIQNSNSEEELTPCFSSLTMKKWLEVLVIQTFDRVFKANVGEFHS